MRRLLTIAGLLASWAATPVQAATWEGEVTTAWPNKGALCIQLPENRSKHVSQLCFGVLGLKWQIGTFAGSPLSSVATKWDLQPTIFLRDDDNAGLGRPLGVFSPAVQNAFKEISMTGVDLAVNVLPNGGAAAVGIGLLPHEGNLGDAGGPYPGNAPSAYSWDQFFVSMAEGDACQYAKDAGGNPVYLAEDIAKTVMTDGFQLANLSACGASFSGLGSFSRALEKSCEAWASDDKRAACTAKDNIAEAETPDAEKQQAAEAQEQPQSRLGQIYIPPAKPKVPPRPAPEPTLSNLDNLLAGIDEPTGGTENRVLHLDGESTAPKKGLEALLSDVEGGYAETVQKQQVAAANTAAAAELKRCQSLVRKFDREIEKYEDFLDRGSRVGFEPGKEGDCAVLVKGMYEFYETNAAYPVHAYTSLPPGWEGFKSYAEDINACVQGRRSKFKQLKSSVAKLKLDTCTFEGTTPAQQLTSLEQAVGRANNAFREEVSRAMDMHAVWQTAVAQANAASVARFYQRLNNSVGNIGNHLQNLGNFDSMAMQEYRTTTKMRTITRSRTTTTTTTVGGIPSGQTNAPLTMDQGTRSGGECFSITNAAQQTRCLNEAHGRAMKQNRARSSSGGSGDTTAKTQ